jgi:hypothetical protein
MDSRNSVGHDSHFLHHCSSSPWLNTVPRPQHGGHWTLPSAESKDTFRYASTSLPHTSSRHINIITSIIHLKAKLNSMSQAYLAHCVHGREDKKGKVVPVLKLIQHVWGERRYSSTFLDFGTRWRWVVSFMPRPLCHRGKSPQYPLNMRLGRPQSRRGTWAVQPVAVAIPTKSTITLLKYFFLLL